LCAEFFLAAAPNNLAASRYATTLRSPDWYARLCRIERIERIESPAAVSKIS